MPPFLPRKRLRSQSPEAGPSTLTSKGKGTAKAVSTTPRKPTLFDDIDAGTGTKRTAEQNKALLEKLAASDEDESSLSDLSDEEFEDVPNAKRQKMTELEDDEDEDIEFEDVDTNGKPGPSGPIPSGDLELTLTKDTRISITNPYGNKKGPSKIERAIRISTHQVHVQMLMFHNAIRNSWLCNKELHEVLVKQLPPSILERVEKWRLDSGLESATKKQAKGKGKDKEKSVKAKKADARSQRDWGEPASRLADGQVNMSGGDPLYGLLKRLMAYWKQRFRITEPGLRKLGYMSLPRLDDEMKSFNNDNHDPELHGERIRDIEEFKGCARAMEGSRDVGAQLFTGLLRGLGLEARLAANLQPVGVGWSQNEEATEKNPRNLKKPRQIDEETSDDEEQDSDEETPAPKPTKKGKGKVPAKPKKEAKPGKRSSRGRGAKDAPIDLSESEELAVTDDDDESVIDITPANQSRQPSKPYDKDLLFPHYWTEVLSPVTNTYTPVDAVVLNMIATSPKLLEKFEPRGAKSEKAKQVTTYIVGHSSDGTAKEVTTRYLRNRMWPSRTKGNRIGVEKVPIYNKGGKVKRYEEYDWFKTVMSGYVRGTKKCPRTEIDDHEEATILKPVKPEKKEVEEGKETLQSYKASSEFVLERHLRREEALLPNAKHVKMFTVKGKGETATEDKVYLRKDVVNCKSMETWHKEGRAPNPGEEPLKRVPYRAATTNRRRELAEAEQASGGKVLQGLYSWDQTDWIIPPPIENGLIPKNSFGNIDLYVDSMLPEGAAHIPYRGTVKICKRLGIDYAEAVTGFEFGHRMAVPIITGVVIAEEHHDTVMEEWQKDEVERERKEDEKRRKQAISMWRKMLMGLRIIERINEEYGDEDGDVADAANPFANSKKSDKDLEAKRRIMEQRDEEMAGGFLPEGYEMEEEVQSPSFFPVAQNDEDDHGGGFLIEGHDEDEGGGFVVEKHNKPAKPTMGQAYATPQSLQSTTKVAQEFEADKVEDMEDVESEIEAPPPKKRGRPSNSVNKAKNAAATSASMKAKKTAASVSSKAKAPTKRVVAQQKTPTSGSARKRELQVEDSQNEKSELSELTSEDSESEVEDVPKQIPTKQAIANQRAPASRSARNTKRRIEDSEDDDNDVSALSQHESEVDEKEVGAPKKVPPKRGGGKRATMPSRAMETRRTPKRNAARKSETALKSHYFDHSDDEDFE